MVIFFLFFFLFDLFIWIHISFEHCPKNILILCVLFSDFYTIMVKKNTLNIAEIIPLYHSAIIK